MTRSQALVLAGHGSQRHPDSAVPTRDHAERIRARGIFDEVRTAFWKEEPALCNVPSVVAAEVTFVVPMLTSEGHFADEVFPRELGPGRDGRSGDATDLRYTDPVGTHAAIPEVVAARVGASIRGPAADVGVAIVGHGTERNEQSAAATRRHADRLRESGRYGEVAALFLEESPAVETLLDVLDAPEVVVVPFFVADGHHVTEDIPRAIGHPGVGESAEIDGRLVHLAGAVGTEPRLADVVVERAIEAGANQRRGPVPFEPSDAERSFRSAVDEVVDWFEWGELAIRGADDGYVLRHRDDRDVAEDALEHLVGPAALRRRARRDDAGRYRPLSGALSLPSGWQLDGLDARGLARAVGAVYPNAIDHWHRERQGTLEEAAWRETVSRQTGIYADLGSLGRRERSAALEAVCGGCVRTRRWPAGREDEPPARSDTEEIPCREACPFLLSAAHAFAESVGDATDEADPGVPPGALARPGNRYRVRFARALDGVAADEVAPSCAGGGD